MGNVIEQRVRLINNAVLLLGHGEIKFKEQKIFSQSSPNSSKAQLKGQHNKVVNAIGENRRDSKII